MVLLRFMQWYIAKNLKRLKAKRRSQRRMKLLNLNLNNFLFIHTWASILRYKISLLTSKFIVLNTEIKTRHKSRAISSKTMRIKVKSVKLNLKIEHLRQSQPLCTILIIFCSLSNSCWGSIGSGRGSFFDLAGRFLRFGESFSLKSWYYTPFWLVQILKVSSSKLHLVFINGSNAFAVRIRLTLSGTDDANRKISTLIACLIWVLHVVHHH